MSRPFRKEAVRVTADNLDDIAEQLKNLLARSEAVIQVEVKTKVGVRTTTQNFTLTRVSVRPDPNPESPNQYQIVGHSEEDGDRFAVNVTIGDTVVFDPLHKIIRRNSAANSVTIKY